MLGQTRRSASTRVVLREFTENNLRILLALLSVFCVAVTVV